MHKRTKPGFAVQISLAGEAREFRDPQMFAEWLAPHREPDQSRLLDAAALSAGDLRQLLESLRNAQSAFRAIRTLADESAEDCLDQLRTVHPRSITQDRQWRELLTQAADWDPDAIAFVRVLLDSYLAYLETRQRRIERLQQRRQVSSRRWDEVSMDMRQQAESEIERRQLERALSRLREGFARLPYNHAISINLPAGGVLRLVLGHHDFELVARGQSVMELVDLQKDEGGGAFRHRYLMTPGVYQVGRDKAADLVIDGEYRDVSRCHMLIDTRVPRRVEFTDLSSQGTFIDAKWLRRSSATRFVSGS